MLRRLSAAYQQSGVDLAFAAAIGIFVASVAGGTFYTLGRLHAEAVANKQAMTALHARAIEDHLTESLAILDMALAHLLPVEEGQASPRELASRLDATLAITPALRSVSLLDESGRIFASTDPTNVGVRVDGSDFLPPQVGESQVLRIGRPWSGRDFGSGAPAGAPIRAENAGLDFIPIAHRLHLGKRWLTVVAAVNPDYFISFYDARLGRDEGKVEVLRYDGTLMLATDAGVEPGSQPEKAPFLRNIAEVEIGSAEETLDDGERVLTAFRASRRYPLAVVVRVDRERALADWAAESRRLLLFVLPALVVLVGLAIPLYIHLRRREERRAETQRRERERLAATVFQTVDGGVVITDADLRAIAVNPAFSLITGYSEAEMAGQRLDFLASAPHASEFFAAIVERLVAAGSWQGEICNRHKDGRLYVAWLSINLVRGSEPGRYVAAFSDITERKASEERIRFLAHHDALTGLPNRAAFWDRLEQALTRIQRDRHAGASLAVLYIDLDEFKPVNDSLGHSAGDDLLKQAAARMQACLRGSDTVARLGGDEFAVLLPALEQPEDAMAVAEKIRQTISLPFDIAGDSIRVSSSIGIAVWPEHGASEEELAQSADRAMYRAKVNGRNRVEVFG